ncbi:peptidoglycan DD-metalloendopeptidase family protein [Microbulbifer sp. VTAC004]|uniref:peptidoglycan DD-metalloendopeptidase family protein n=1 Tax=Microbulbifer sp. VTAC004 TaxID=3243386 RepID=UPI0040398608
MSNVTSGGFFSSCSKTILKCISILLVVISPLTVMEAKGLSQHEGFFKINNDILTIFFSSKPSQMPLRLGNGPIVGVNQEGSSALESMVVRVKEVSLSKNQGVLSLLAENSIGKEESLMIVKLLSEYLDINAVAVGKKFLLAFDEESRFQSLSVNLAFAESLEIKKDGQELISVKQQNPTTLQNYYVEGEISGSLYNTGLNFGLNNAVLVKLNEILSYEVDFQREIRSGDSFSVFYSTRRDELKGDEVFQSIHFAEVSLSNDVISLYRYQDGDSGVVDYFHPDGKSSRSFLMKTPLENAQLSSYFGRRKHPVLGFTRMHKGLDFGAPLGTPILAAGDGIIERASYFGSFGNYIRIGHQSGVQTIYSHLRGYAKGIKAGVRVEQGQVIGYLGATGRVQGRHLHYEIHKNGRPVDPLRLDLPASNNLSGRALDRFFEYVKAVDKDLDVHRAVK